MTCFALVVLLVVAVAIIGCSPSDYCDHYDDWAAADRALDQLEVRNGTNLSTWASGDVDRLETLTYRRDAAAYQLWEIAPPNANWTSIRAECR